jgi:hypothetical protein
LNAVPGRAGALLVPLALFMTLCHAASSVQGRWEGDVQIPGAPMKLVVDLAQDQTSTWAGSVIVPGLGVKGAALDDIVVSDSSIAFALAGALHGPAEGPPRVKAHMIDADTMAGDFGQAGNTAALTLNRTGPAQVEPAPRSTTVTHELEGAWSGTFDFDGHPRQVTLTLTNRAEQGASAEFVIVGKRTTQVPVDLVVQDRNFLKIESHQTGISFEGQWRTQAGEIQGSVQMGALEVPLVLRRSVATNDRKS